MRLDLYVSAELNCTRTRASNIIKMGGVTVNGRHIVKAGSEVSDRDVVEITDSVKYTSLGGVKLENALDYFHIDLNNKICLDLGAANGGFTQCMLTRGAKHVSAVDLSLAFPEFLVNDPRITIFDGVNVKNVNSVFVANSFDFISVDLSFISLNSLFPLFYPLLKQTGILIVLFKPQYEVGRKYLPKSGVVHDIKAMEKAFLSTKKSAEECGFLFLGDCYIPDYFSDKNKERTICFTKH